MTTAQKYIELTKAQEIELITNFVNELPKYSYLRSMLGDCLPEIISNITSDLGYIAYRDRQAEMAQYHSDITAAELRLRELKNETAQLERKRNQFENEIDDIRRQAASLAAC